MNTVFIYYKEGKIKALDLANGEKEHKELVNGGWKHTQTLDPCKWMEFLFNEANGVEALEMISGLKAG